MIALKLIKQNHFSSVVQYPLSKCSILSAKTFGLDIIQFIRQLTKSVSCQSQTENHISHPTKQLINQNKFTHHQTNYQWHQQTETQISYHHNEVALVAQKTHLHPEKSRYQTPTACQ